MTKVFITEHENGSATLSTPYGMAIDSPSFDCDICGKPTAYKGRYEHLASGFTGRECAVMWLCPPCGIKDGADEHTDECTHE